MLSLIGLALLLVPAIIADFSYQNTSDRPMIVERDNLTSRLLGNVFTIEFRGGESIHSMNANESAREEFYLRLRDALLRYLNKKSQANATHIPDATHTTTKAIPETSSSEEVTSFTTATTLTTTSTEAPTTITSATTSTAAPTTITSATTSTAAPTTITAATTRKPQIILDPGISKRKKRSQSRLSADIYPPDSIKFINLREHLRNNTFFVTLTLDSYSKDELREAIQSIQDTDALFNETTLSVQTFYEGFPKESPKTSETTTTATAEVKPSSPDLKILWIIFPIIILIIIMIAICICCHRRKRRRNLDIAMMTPVNHQILSNNHPNSIMNDNGWIIPMREVHLPQ